MPLNKGAKPGSKGFKQNIKTEMAALFSKSMTNMLKVL